MSWADRLFELWISWAEICIGLLIFVGGVALTFFLTWLARELEDS